MEKEIILKAQAGDSEACGLIYTQMYKRVYYLALRLTNNSEDAEDAAQETFISAFNALNGLENPEAFESWLFQICSNRCRNLLRKNSRLVALEEDEEGNTILDDMVDPNEALIPETAMQDAEQRRLIMDIVKALPQDQKECVFLFYFSNLSVKEIAEELNCSEGTVKSRLNYARQKIKASVLAIEKRDGIRLHSLAPIGLLFAMDFEVSAASISIPILETAGAAAVGSAAVGSTAATTVKTAAASALKTKIIAGVTAAAVVAGGVGTYVAMKQEPLSEPLPYVEFVDATMEHNMHILLNIPAEEPILQSDLSDISAVFFIEDGMALMSDEWILGWLTEYGSLTETPDATCYPLYSIEMMAPVEGTLPVTNLTDLQYIGSDALWIGVLVSDTMVDMETLENCFPDCVVRNTPTGGIKAPFTGAEFWDENGATRVNEDDQLSRLGSYGIIRNPEYVAFSDSNMELSMHILLEVPNDKSITTYEMGQIRQLEFYEGHVDFFNGHCWYQGNDFLFTREPQTYDDLKFLNEEHLLISASTPDTIDKEAILAVRPDATFHFFSEE